MKKTFSVITLGLFLLSCNTSEKANLDKLEDEVIGIHDEIMPKMGEILDLKNSISEKINKLDSTASNYKRIKLELDSISNSLTAADDSMMDWMDEYNADTLKAISSENGLKYLEEQKKKIADIKAHTLENIEAAKTILKK